MSKLQIMPIVSCFKRLTCLFVFIMLEVIIQLRLKKAQLAAQWTPSMEILFDLYIMFEIQLFINSICHYFIFTGVFTAAFDCQIEWLIVKGIADYADGSQLASESWSSCASVMAASLVAHILSEPCVFHSWPHYQGQ